MALFRREPEPPRPANTVASAPRETPTSAPAGRKNPTLVAEGTRVVGNIHGPTDVLIEGEVEGQVQVDSRVTIGPGGRVKGEVSARSVQVSGKVQGNIRAVDRIEITTTGALEGDVAAPKVIIAEGAFFKGKVEMTGAAEPAAPAAAERPRGGKDAR